MLVELVLDPGPQAGIVGQRPVLDLEPVHRDHADRPTLPIRPSINSSFSPATPTTEVRSRI